MENSEQNTQPTQIVTDEIEIKKQLIKWKDWN